MAEGSSAGWLVPALLGAVVGVALGVAIGPKGDAREGALALEPDREVVEWGARPVRGPEGATVTIVEFTDYQCPFCREWHQDTYPRLLAEYGDRVRYEVRHFPVQNAHPFAEPMARAAVCAHRQGRFWDYHDRLFEGPFTEPDREAFEDYARSLRLDPLAFSSCLDSEGSLDMVSGDFLHGVELGVRSTPSFWIGGRLLRGAQSFPALQSVLDPLLATEGPSGF